MKISGEVEDESVYILARSKGGGEMNFSPSSLTMYKVTAGMSLSGLMVLRMSSLSKEVKFYWMGSGIF